MHRSFVVVVAVGALTGLSTPACGAEVRDVTNVPSGGPRVREGCLNFGPVFCSRLLCLHEHAIPLGAVHCEQHCHLLMTVLFRVAFHGSPTHGWLRLQA